MSWKWNPHKYSSVQFDCLVHWISPLGHDTVSHWQSLVKRRVDCHRRFAAVCPYGRGWTVQSQLSVEPEGQMTSTVSLLITYLKMAWGIQLMLVHITTQRGSFTFMLPFSSRSTFSSFRSLCTTPFWRTIRTIFWLINESMHCSWPSHPRNELLVVLRHDLL